MKFHIIELADEPEGYVNVSTSAEWESWIRHCLPDGLDQEVRRRLVSNLKHVTVGLELKAALIVPHAERGAGPSLLFEPYLHIMRSEEHTSELQSLMRISYAVFCLKKKKEVRKT